MIPGASSRLVRPVQLICRCCRGRRGQLGWKEPGAPAEHPHAHPHGEFSLWGWGCPLHGAGWVRYVLSCSGPRLSGGLLPARTTGVAQAHGQASLASESLCSTLGSCVTSAGHFSSSRPSSGSWGQQGGAPQASQGAYEMMGLGGLGHICSWAQTQCLGSGGQRRFTGSGRPASSWGLTGF